MKINKKHLAISLSTISLGVFAATSGIVVTSCSFFANTFRLSKKTYNEIKQIVSNAADANGNNTTQLVEQEILNALNTKENYNDSILEAKISLNKDNDITKLTLTFDTNKIEVKKVKVFKDNKIDEVIYEDFKFPNKSTVECSFINSPIPTNITNTNNNLKPINVDFSKLEKLYQQMSESIIKKPISPTIFNNNISENIPSIAKIIGIKNDDISKIVADTNTIKFLPKDGYTFKLNNQTNNITVNNFGQIEFNNINFLVEKFTAIENDSLLFNPITASLARTVSVNVGMGDSEIIQISSDNTYGGDDDFTILIDGGTGGIQGGKDSSSPDGVDAVASALSWLNVKDIDLFVISHPHNDHMYGLPEIIMNYATDNSKALVGIDAWEEKASSSPTTVMRKIECALTEKKVETFDSVQIINTVNENNLKGNWTPGKLVKFNDQNNQEIGSFSVLGCTEKMVDKNNKPMTSMNAYSVSNMFTFNGFKELFAGDSEECTDKQLIEYYNQQELDCDIYKVSHHGSFTEGSNSIEWLNKIKPTYAIISAGAEDKYTLPDAQTLQNLITAGVQPENILGTQPFGKSLILANTTNGNDEKNTKNWENINNFLKQHPTINNNNRGSCVEFINNQYKMVSGEFVDLNSKNLPNEWTTVDGYYNMVMKGIGIVFDFSNKSLGLNKVATSSVKSDAWNPSKWDEKNWKPTSPNGSKWISIPKNYKQFSGLPQIINIQLKGKK